MTDPLAELAALGNALGGVRWAQGPGGNVSVKTDDGELWIKASGKLLVDVAKPDGHAKVKLGAAKRALAGDTEADKEVFAAKPRPSLETYFHALGNRVVAHTHALGVLLYACSNAPFAAAVRPGIAAIPYVTPGRGVALAIADVIDRIGDEGLVVLRSHGVVAYAPTAMRAIELTVAYDEEVRAQSGALAPFEPLVAAYLATPSFAVGDGFGRKLPSRKPSMRYLLPDAVVCASTIPVPTLDDAPKVLANLKRACVPTDAGGDRVLVARSESELRQSTEVLAAHDWLEDELTHLGTVQYLPEDEPARILGLPSEQYRIQLAESAK